MDYQTIRQNFENHGFTTRFFPTREEATDYFAKKLQRSTIGFGGSITLSEMGLHEALQQKNVVVWHNKVQSRDVRRRANLTSIWGCRSMPRIKDVFFCHTCVNQQQRIKYLY
ncbi:lactate utilization protein [Oxalobacter vibrioformis]|uniref:Lactate utilization protein n=1 Tax=Oxalobacter vibrioformis TaxID=933080 RepID=A0A9E9LWF8_9BURK|nr:LUD domain-containing protein [Oxalobacter vibrioformis]WAW10099.1 lactate utilization protein [Oxalobacter vibrioformis]